MPSSRSLASSALGLRSATRGRTAGEEAVLRGCLEIDCVSWSLEVNSLCSVLFHLTKEKGTLGLPCQVCSFAHPDWEVGQCLPRQTWQTKLSAAASHSRTKPYCVCLASSSSFTLKTCVLCSASASPLPSPWPSSVSIAPALV